MKSPIQRFIAIVKELRDGVLNIPTQISSLGSAIDKHTNAINQSTEADKKKRETPPVVRPEIKIPITTEAHDKEEPQEKKWRERIKVLLEFITLFAVIWYACEAHKQSSQMRLATNNTEWAFKIGNRAQITIDNIRWRINEGGKKRVAVPQKCSDEGGAQHICFEIDFKNGGHSPATGTEVVAHVILPKHIPDAKETIEGFAFRPVALDGHQPMSSGDHQWDAYSFEEVCGKSPCIAPKEADDMIHGETALYIYGFIQYQDIFNARHVTRFCFVQPPTACTYPPGGCMIPCTFGNWMDRPDDVPAN